MLVRQFIRLGRSLERALPGERPRAEREMARLVSTFERELLQIATTAVDDMELQLAAWLRDLASLPTGTTISREFPWIRASLRMLPRPRGSYVLEDPAYPLPDKPLTSDS